MTASKECEQDPAPRQAGHLDVGDGHKVFFEEWGNPDATPIFHLHGGPGSGCKAHHKTLYNPLRQRVIFHDQRGSGRSAPFAETENNETKNLIGDIERLRTFFGFDLMYVVGHSWGSTLALSYAIVHPQRVRQLVLSGIYLAREFEDDFVNEGWAKYIFPEAWDRFIRRVPESCRTSGKAIMAHYAEMIRSPSSEVSDRYSREWTLWEATVASSTYDRQDLEQEILKASEEEAKKNYGAAKIQTHYLPNGCFIRKTPILENLSAIKHIPCSVVQGRFDLCTPPVSAYQLSLAYGANLYLQWVNSGHKANPEMRAALRATIAATLAD